MLDVVNRLAGMTWMEILFVLALSSCVVVFILGSMGLGDDFHE